MKVAIIGLRKIKNIDIEKRIPKDTALIILGGARGIDTLAEKYADEKNCIPELIQLDCEICQKRAPLVRNKLIVQNADWVIVIWDGMNMVIKHTIDYAKSLGKNLKIILVDRTGTEILPGNFGNDCPGNGIYVDKTDRTIECCCDACDYLMCCVDHAYPHNCSACPEEYCPRKF